jgi:hypothetical protein
MTEIECSAYVLEPRIIFSDDHHVIAAFDSVVVLIAGRPATPDHVRMIDRTVRELVVKWPKGVSYIHVVDSLPGETRRIPDDTRKALVDLAKGAPPETRCVSITLLAEGFIAAAMRGVVAAALAAFRFQVPLRVTSSVEETCFWVEQSYRKVGAPCPPARELTNAITKLRDELPARNKPKS